MSRLGAISLGPEGRFPNIPTRGPGGPEALT